MDSYDILVIFLSVALGIFLVFGIILLIALIKFTKQLSEIADKADAVMDDVESVSTFIRKATGPAAIMSFISNIVGNVMDKKGKSKE